MTKKQNDYPPDVMISILLSAGLVALLVKSLADAGIMGYWWGFFMFANLIYIIHSMKKGTIKGDPANAMVIVAGPIAFYFWTTIGAWRKYKPRRNHAKNKKT